ncbi:sigma-70 family RNA polymerase sigma factor [Flexivirga sp. ID2601S]|uniref:Sigma-70 family RNA polymerase sigma factor n=1 Tax=Flexivirga aerilata TaxID=1656889 RepID=A0A849AKE9_9MICO|nr:sigma-70 family RNA polymerase sigma factor [Flexivirga aerilata]NNG40885.1 sigma-70 family RNA polymerase sigma factor [Flexivirga aerilata]
MPSVIQASHVDDTVEVRTNALLALAHSCAEASQAARYREQAILLQRPLARHLARRFEGRGIDADDLRQVAFVGLVLAVHRFSPQHARTFRAFAVPTISGELKRHFRDHGWAVRPPRAVQENRIKVQAAQQDLLQQLGRAPSVDEVAQALGEPPQAVRMAQAADQQYRSESLDAPLRDDTSVSLADTLPDRSSTEAFERVEMVEELRPALAALTSRERQIVRLRFVDNLTQREIGERIGTSQMQVSRLLTGILARLQQHLTARSADADA